MQLYDNVEAAEAQYKQIADDLHRRFSKSLAHDWSFDTTFAIDALTRKEIPKLGGDILIDVARATVGRRWERGIGRSRAIGAIWDRLIRSTWLRLNQSPYLDVLPLAGVSSKSSDRVLGAYIAAPSSADLSDQERTVPASGSDRGFWSHAKTIWDDLTTALEMREPFVVCIGYSNDEIQLLHRQWETTSRIHPPLHIIQVGAESALNLSQIACSAPETTPIEDYFEATCAKLASTPRWCSELLFSASKCGVLPYDHHRVGPAFLAGVARLVVGKTPLTYIFPAAGIALRQPARGFLVGATQPLDGETAKLFWSLGDILFSEYQEEMLIEAKEPPTALPPLPTVAVPRIAADMVAREKEAIRQASIKLLKQLNDIYLPSHTVVGNYVRFAPEVVESLSSVARQIEVACDTPTQEKENHLIWAPAGQGKTYLIQEIAKVKRVAYLELDLKVPGLTADSLRSQLAKCETGPEPHLCLIDEIDSRSTENWVYDTIYGFLGLNETKPVAHGNKIFVLIGSTPTDFAALEHHIKNRWKGNDLWRRIRYKSIVPPLTLGDRLVVAISQIRRLAAEKNCNIQAVERLALLYLLTEVGSTAGHLTDFLKPVFRTLAPVVTRLRLVDLFGREDEQKKLNFIFREKKTAKALDMYLNIRD